MEKKEGQNSRGTIPLSTHDFVPMMVEQDFTTYSLIQSIWDPNVLELFCVIFKCTVAPDFSGDLTPSRFYTETTNMARFIREAGGLSM